MRSTRPFLRNVESRLSFQQLEERQLLAAHGMYADATSMLVDFNQEEVAPRIFDSTVHDNGIVHLVADEIGDYELWKTDASSNDAVRILEIFGNQLPFEDENSTIVSIDDRLYFDIERIDDRFVDRFQERYGLSYLWTSEGTTETTHQIANLAWIDDITFSWPTYGEHSGKLLLRDVRVPWQGRFSIRLLQSDGTVEGTSKSGPFSHLQVVPLNDQFYVLGMNDEASGLFRIGPDFLDMELIKEFEKSIFRYA